MLDFYREKIYFQVENISLQAVSSYSSDQSKTGSSGVIEHYTQVVWAETAEVGCGYMAHLVNRRYERVKHLFPLNLIENLTINIFMFVNNWIVISCIVRFFHQVLVCNYGPAGNIEGAPVYEQGETGSNCPTGTSKTPLGLCANDDN